MDGVARRDRVFLAAVGTSAEPMEDNWLETPRGWLHLEKIWTSGPSNRLDAGDHVVAIRAGRRGDLYGDLIMLAEATGPVVADPHPYAEAAVARLRYGFPLRPLIVVPGGVARRVPGLDRAPRGSLWERTDPAELDAIYACLVDGVRWPRVDAHRSLRGEIEVVRERLPRAFDPRAEPSAPAAAVGSSDPEGAAVAAEKATRGHHRLVTALHELLGRAGWRARVEVERGFDLRAVAPDGRTVIFEAKTVTSHNVLPQLRSAIAQLLEYRHTSGPASAELCVVTDGPVPARRVEILRALEFAVVELTDAGVRVVASPDGGPLAALDDV